LPPRHPPARPHRRSGGRGPPPGPLPRARARRRAGRRGARGAPRNRRGVRRPGRSGRRLAGAAGPRARRRAPAGAHPRADAGAGRIAGPDLRGAIVIPSRVFEQTLLSFFAPIRPFLDDPTVTEVMINGPSEIFVERRGKLERTDARFDGPHALAAAIRNLAQYAGRHVSEDVPILEAHLPDGSRVEAVLPPASPDGPHISIRRFFRQALSMETLIEWRSVSAEAARLLQALVACKQNI